MAWPIVGNFPGAIASSLAASRRDRRQPSGSPPRHSGSSATVEIRTLPRMSTTRPNSGTITASRTFGSPRGPQARALPRMGPQQARRRSGAHAVQPAVRRDGVRPPASTPCSPGTSTPRRWASWPPTCARRLPDLADRFHRPRPEPLEPLASWKPWPSPSTRRHRRPPDVRPHRQPPAWTWILPARGSANRPPPDRPGHRQGPARSTSSPATSGPPNGAADVPEIADSQGQDPLDRPRRDPAGHAPTLLRVLRRRPDPAGADRRSRPGRMTTRCRMPWGTPSR